MFNIFSKKDSKKDKKGGDSDEEEAEEEKGDSPADDDEAKEKEEDVTPMLLAECMAKFANNTRFSDVTFVVGAKKVKVPAHRLVLSVTSPVFDAMLYVPEGFSEKKEDKLPLEVALPDEDPDVFAAMLQCVYSDLLKVDADTVQGLIKIASKFEIEKLKQLCVDFVSEEVNEDNALDLLTMATALGSDSSDIMEFVAENAEKVLESDGFLKLDKQAVKVLLDNDKLCVNEIAVMRAVLAWGKEEAKRTKTGTSLDDVKKLVPDLISMIRFPLLEVEELASQVAPTGVLDQNVLVMLFAYCATSEEAKKKKMAATVPFPTRPREGTVVFKKSKILEPKQNKPLMKLMEVKRCKAELLYRGADHGYSASSFHSRCDGKGATLTLVRANGHIFGGFNGDSWTQNNNYTTGEAYIFNLVNTQNRPPLKMIGHSNKCYGGSNYGPTWGGGHDLYINNSMKSASNSSNPSSFSVASGYNGTFNNTTLAGSQSFTVDEIEVWGIKK